MKFCKFNKATIYANQYLMVYKWNNKNLNISKENEKYFVDLKGINKQQLLEMGVSKIDVCPFCTNCGEKIFYSYRFENKTGYRHSAVVKCG